MAACSKKKLIPPYVQTIKIKGKTPDLCVEKQHLYKRAPTDAKVSRFGSQSFQVADLARLNTCVCHAGDHFSKKTQSKFISSGFEKESTNASLGALELSRQTPLCVTNLS